MKSCLIQVTKKEEETHQAIPFFFYQPIFLINPLGHYYYYTFILLLYFCHKLWFLLVFQQEDSRNQEKKRQLYSGLFEDSLELATMGCSGSSQAKADGNTKTASFSIWVFWDLFKVLVLLEEKCFLSCTVKNNNVCAIFYYYFYAQFSSWLCV